MRQKEIWIVNLDPTIGSEMRKSRPCVILNQNEIGKLPLKVIAPLTDYKPHYREVAWMVGIEPDNQNGIDKKSVIDLFQIRSVSQDRLVKRVGAINDEAFLLCKEALEIVVK